MSIAHESFRFWAVIPAAGSGTRMECEQPKQYLPLLDKAMLEWTLLPFLQAEWLDGVVVVLAKNDAYFANLPISAHPKLRLAVGGETRVESVQAGLSVVAEHAFTPEQVKVLVHDAARPCITADLLNVLRRYANDTEGALLAIPCADTMKRGRGNKVTETVDRRGLWRAQTPQMFGLKALQHALAECVGQGIQPTDESSAMEYLGGHPALVIGSERNLKVTVPSDLACAEFLLAREGKV